MTRPPAFESSAWRSFATCGTLVRAAGGRWLVPADEFCPFRQVSTDSRTLAAGDLFVAIRGEKFDGHAFAANAARAGAAAVVIDQPDLAGSLQPLGVPVLLVADTTAALLALAAAWRARLETTRVIAVVGAVGKTTTKQLIHAALASRLTGTASAKSFNNHVGVPATLFAAQPDDEFVIAEVGTNHVGEIARLAAVVRPDVVVITNIGHEHLEGLGDLDGVAREECSILDFLSAAGRAVPEVVSFGDQPLLRSEIARHAPSFPAGTRVTWFGRAADSDLRLERVTLDLRGATFTLAGCCRMWRIPLAGAHFALDALAAIAVGRILSLTDESIAHGLAATRSADMRFAPAQVPLPPGGTALIFNDAYNANPDSMAAALAAFGQLTASSPGRRLLMLGQMGELGSASIECHRNLAAPVNELHRAAPLDAVLLVGPSMADTAAALAKDPALLGRVHHFPDVSLDTMRRCATFIQPGDRVLLKGSRSVGMERILGCLAEDRPAAAPSTSSSTPRARMPI